MSNRFQSYFELKEVKVIVKMNGGYWNKQLHWIDR